ncbi:MAG: holo-ACP synthase [Anaerolineae bacterium]
MYTIGVDLIEVVRIEQAVARWGDRFLQRVYTPAEIGYCAGRAGSLAARWAAKEAVSKALGTGWAPQTPHEAGLDRLARDRGGTATVGRTGPAAARQGAGPRRRPGHCRAGV